MKCLLKIKAFGWHFFNQIYLCCCLSVSNTAAWSNFVFIEWNESNYSFVKLIFSVNLYYFRLHVHDAVASSVVHWFFRRPLHRWLWIRLSLAHPQSPLHERYYLVILWFCVQNIKLRDVLNFYFNILNKP